MNLLRPPPLTPPLGHVNKRTFVRLSAYGVTSTLGVFIIVALLFPEPSRWLASGPANTGHESLECKECHKMSRGSLRQRMQAIVKQALGLRDTGAPIVYKSVTNQECNHCHVRDHDQHAPHLFNEPRFQSAREAADPRRCVTCHAEHQGGRVTREGTECRYCHDELEIQRDPISPSHIDLIQSDDWKSCLRCHDYHDGHRFKPPTDHNASIDPALIKSYLDGLAPSPFGPSIYPSRQPVQ